MQRRKRVDPRVIGSFVVGAVILSVAGLFFFGPGGILSETRTYVIYFNSSVKGLNVGSPVRFRGVKIGQIKEISVRVRPTDFEFNIPVVVEIEPSRIEAEGSKQGFIEAFKTAGDPMESLVQKGLRAQLQLDSLVTGQLYINFDMHPEAPLNLTGYNNEYAELPSISSSLDELTKTIEDLPLRELVKKLIHSADGFDKIVNSPDLHSSIARFDSMAEQMNQLLTDLNRKFVPLVDQLSNTMDQVQSTLGKLDKNIDPLASELKITLEQARATLQKIDGTIDPLSEEVSTVLKAFETTVNRADATLEHFSGLTSRDSHLLKQVSATLKEVNQAARDARFLLNELERDPQMILRGRADGGRQ